MISRKICVSIGEKDEQEFYSTLESVIGVDCVEIRLDYLPALQVANCFTKTDIDLLFTCRASWEGGLYNGSEEDRVQLFTDCIDSGASFIDLELASPVSSIETVINHRIKTNATTKLILSHHDFLKTPVLEDLTDIIIAMKSAGADIGKLITTAQDSTDMLRIIVALEYARSIDFPLIAFCMGDAGVMSRVACCDFGSYMTYCAADGKAVTASSQLKLSTMNDIFAKLPA